MDSRSFLGLRSAGDGRRWSLTVTPELCAGGEFLFGGAGLAAAVAAMEDATGRATIWATAQYLSYARPGWHVDIEVTIAVAGHQMTQSRAICRVGDREILTVNAALGHRPFPAAGQFAAMPDVPGPEHCPPRPMRYDPAGTIGALLEQRVVKYRQLDQLDGVASDGRTLMWMRMPAMIEGVDASTLAVLGDFVPVGVGQALGIAGGGNSLDNTLRVVDLVPTEWVLLDIRIDAAARGFGHGSVHMFAQDGTLLATASQSCIVRFWKDRPVSAPTPPGPEGQGSQ